jgi:signal peptidase I
LAKRITKHLTFSVNVPKLKLRDEIVCKHTPNGFDVANKSRNRKQTPTSSARADGQSDKNAGQASARHSKNKAEDATDQATEERTADGRHVTKEGFIVGKYTPSREIIESLAVAVILAFMFKTFVAEMFVIPTGSMAPTLMGRHKDFDCPMCGYDYRVGASSEMNRDDNKRNRSNIVSGICPQCRYMAYIGENNPQEADYNSYTGDRIIVTKFPFEFRDPHRFEICVFHFPGSAGTNYIKRIVGLPNETLRITQGDLWTRAPDAEEFQIARKPHRQLRSMLQSVYDNDYRIQNLAEIGWPDRWTSDQSSNTTAKGAWATENGQRFIIDGTTPSERLRYRHCPPMVSDWNDLEQGLPSPRMAEGVKPQLISDFNPYNTGLNDMASRTIRNQIATREARNPGFRSGFNWVGDLAVECELTFESNEGEAILELIEGGVVFQCRLDPASGRATMLIPERPEFEATGDVNISAGEPCDILFSNIDNELRLWVDDRPIEFEQSAAYEPFENGTPTEEDLSPVRLGSEGAALAVDHLRVFRDIYYLADRSDSSEAEGGYVQTTEYDTKPFLIQDTEEKVVNYLSDPERFASIAPSASVEFEIGEGEFFACGDNTSDSLDGRIWPGKYPIPHTINRRLLIGKAVFVYWPHGWEIPGTPFPFVPNFPRMRWIR